MAPEPLSTPPATEPEKSAWVSSVLGWVEREVDQWLYEKRCRELVRAENQKAFRAQ